jgi:hypothetical protein
MTPAKENHVLCTTQKQVLACSWTSVLQLISVKMEHEIPRDSCNQSCILWGRCCPKWEIHDKIEVVQPRLGGSRAKGHKQKTQTSLLQLTPMSPWWWGSCCPAERGRKDADCLLWMGLSAAALQLTYLWFWKTGTSSQLKKFHEMHLTPTLCGKEHKVIIHKDWWWRSSTKK